MLSSNYHTIKQANIAIFGGGLAKSAKTVAWANTAGANR